MSGKRPRPNTSSAASKRSRPAPPPLTVGDGDVLFRLLCPTALSGGVIGKSGAIVRQLQTDTSSKIRVEESLPGVEDRAVVVIASKALTRRIDLEREGESEVAEVSAAQEAVIRVFERMVEVMKEERESVGEVVTCRMLAETSQVGGVIGKGGKVIEKIRRDSKCRIRVSNEGVNLPACALPNEQMMEMEGNVLAVKRALLAITGRLQECPPLENAKISDRRPYQTPPYSNFPNNNSTYAPDRMPTAPPSSYPFAPRGRYSTEMGRAPVLDPRAKQEEIVFRILCLKDRIGGVIGKGGTIVNALQDETGASITAGGSVPDCDERLITITAKENPESQFSPGQNAVILVFKRCIEAGYEKGLLSPGNKIVSARMAIPGNQIGCLIGNGGSVISEMRMTSGADIRIVEHGKLPRCATENDEVIEVTGEFVNVQDALFNVTGRLRQNLFSYINPCSHGTITNSIVTEMSLYKNTRDPSLGLHTSIGLSPSVNPHAPFSQNMDHFRSPDNIYNHPPTSMPWATQGVGGLNPRGIMDVGSGPASVKGGIELGSGSRSAIVRNTTVEIVVPNNVIGSVYGENGSNLARLRQISGAKVAVHEPHPGTADWTIVISGTPDETQAAQSLVQAFILTGQS